MPSLRDSDDGALRTWDLRPRLSHATATRLSIVRRLEECEVSVAFERPPDTSNPNESNAPDHKWRGSELLLAAALACFT